MEAGGFPTLQYTSQPEAVFKVQQEYSESGRSCPNGNFLKGVSWSPDGTCFLTASDDNRLRVYDLPPDVLEARSLGNATESALDGVAAAADSAAPPLTVQEGELVYDYAWYSAMSAAEPASCCFATSCRAHPIHLWDACTGELRCSYRAFDDNDEVTAANSLAFSPDGAQLAAGANKVLRVFDTSRPGRSYRSLKTFARKQGGQPGIVSCLAYSPDGSGLLAAGAYSGVAALYDAHSLAPAALLAGGHTGGITQVQFSPDGNFLYTGARQDGGVQCWDIRSTGEVLYTLRRDTRATNQRIQFSIEPCGRHMATGGSDGQIRVYDLVDGSEVASFAAGHDTLNGCQYHPFLPLLGTASGHRRFLAAASDDSSDEEASSAAKQAGGDSESSQRLENALLVWRLECSWPAVDGGGEGGARVAVGQAEGAAAAGEAEDAAAAAGGALIEPA